jgi:hypothetical protein
MTRSNPQAAGPARPADSFLDSWGLPTGQTDALASSAKRFPDGAQYRIEIPSTEGPACLDAPDLYPAGLHLESVATAMSRERVRRARLGLELLARSGYTPVISELGAAGLAVPEP